MEEILYAYNPVIIGAGTMTMNFILQYLDSEWLKWPYRTNDMEQ